MRNLLLSAAFAATTAVVAMPAIAAPLQHFTRDGEDYSYAAARQADGAILLRGTVDSTGDAFVLRVRGEQVQGHLGMSNVSFHISPATAAELANEVGTASTTLASN